MRIIGCDLHARQQTLSMLDTESGEVTEKTLAHEGEAVREFTLRWPSRCCGLEATGSMFWFLRLLEELGIGVPRGTSGGDSQGGDTEAETRPARCGVDPAAAGGESVSADLAADPEQRDLRTLLRHRHQLVRMRVMTQNGLQGWH